MDEYSPEMKAILMHDKKLVKIDNRVTDLENHMTIDYGEQVVLVMRSTRRSWMPWEVNTAMPTTRSARKYLQSATAT